MEEKKKLNTCALLSFLFALIVAGMVFAGFYFKIYLLFVFQVFFGIAGFILGIVGLAKSRGHVVSVLMGSVGVIAPLAAATLICINIATMGISNFFKGMVDRSSIIEVIEEKKEDIKESEEKANDFLDGIKKAAKGATKNQVKEMIKEASDEIGKQIDENF